MQIERILGLQECDPQTITDEESCERLPISDMWGVVWLDGHKKWYIGTTSMPTEKRLVATDQAHEVNPTELQSYTQPLPSLREFDLTSSNIAHLIPVGLDLQQVEITNIASSEGDTLATIRFHLHPPHRVADTVFAPQPVTLDFPLSSFLAEFMPGQQGKLFENVELRTGQRKTFLLLRNPQDSSEALAMYFEDYSHRGIVNDRNKRSGAAAASVFEHIVDRVSELYPNHLPKIMRAIEQRSDFKDQENSLLRALMKLQTCASVYKDLESGTELSFFNTEWRAYRWKTWNTSAFARVSDLLVNTLETSQFTVGRGTYDDIISENARRLVEQEEERVRNEAAEEQRRQQEAQQLIEEAQRAAEIIAQREPKIALQREQLQAVARLLPSEQGKVSNPIFLHWLSQVVTIGKQSDYREICFEAAQMIEQFLVTTDSGKKRIQLESITTETLKPYLADEYTTISRKKLIEKASTDLRRGLIREGRKRLQLHKDFDLLNLAVNYDANVTPGPEIYSLWIEALYKDAADRSDADHRETIIRMLFSFALHGQNRTLKAYKTYTGRDFGYYEPENMKTLSAVALAASTKLRELTGK